MLAGLLPRARRTTNAMLDLLLPPLCPMCGQKVSGAPAFCPPCFAALKFVDPPFCGSCGFPFESYVQHNSLCFACRARPPAFDRAFSPLIYDKAIDQPILAFKHADATQHAPLFASLLSSRAPHEFLESTLILPVPLHPFRLWRRLYNQSALLARCLSRTWNLPWAANLLLRVKHTSPLGKRTPRQRYLVLKNIFVCPLPHKVRDQRILLVDDVMTSALTAEFSARTLKNAGARSVFVLTLARVYLPRPNLAHAV